MKLRERAEDWIQRQPYFNPNAPDLIDRVAEATSIIRDLQTANTQLEIVLAETTKGYEGAFEEMAKRGDENAELRREIEGLKAFLRQVKAMLVERYQPNAIATLIDALLTEKKP